MRVRMRVTATKIAFSVIKANDFPIDISQQVIGFGLLEHLGGLLKNMGGF